MSVQQKTVMPAVSVWVIILYPATQMVNLAPLPISARQMPVMPVVSVEQVILYPV